MQNFFVKSALSKEVQSVNNKIQLNEGKYKRFGAIVNTDKHTGSGIHWMSIFIEYFPKENLVSVEFYDSVSPKKQNKRFVQKEIKEFFDKIYKELRNNVICNKKICKKSNIERKINIISAQKKNSECGVYSIFFIYARLAKIDFNFIDSNPISDDEMNAFRSILFKNYQDVHLDINLLRKITD